MYASNIVREYARLGRIHSSILSGLAPVIGAMVMGLVEVWLLILLFLIGIMTHIFGFVANEYIDLDIDRHSTDLSEKPLVKGTISKKGAKSYMIGAIVVAYILTIILFFLGSFKFTILELLVPISFLTLSWVSIGAYDLVSKKYFGADILLALWPFFLCLFGGAVVSLELSPLLYVVAGLAFMQLLIQNIMAGLKDIDHDHKAGGVSTPIRMGVKIKHEQMEITPNFKAFINILKVFYLVLIFSPFIMGWLEWEWIQIILIIAFYSQTYYLSMLICHTQPFDRKQIIRHIGGHEIIAYSIIPVLLMHTIGIWHALVLIIVPVIWLAIFLRLLYGGLMPEI